MNLAPSGGKRRVRSALSFISKLHYLKLVCRSLLFLAAGTLWLLDRDTVDRILSGKSLGGSAILLVIWIVYLLEMICRMFPSRLESMGCQRQFSHNYKPTGQPPVKPKNQSRAVAAVIAAWVALNGIIGGLYLLGVFDRGVLMLVSLAYGVCDMICILFFCPFQVWFLKNKCCTTCRIYNWDFAMMFTPLIFMPSLYTWSLAALSLALLVRWEITYATHPERFYECSNSSLACANCQERLCNQKKSIQRIRKQLMAGLKEELVELKDGIKKELRK